MMTSQPTDNHKSLQYNTSLNGLLHKLNALLEEELATLHAPKPQALEDFARKKVSLFSQLRVLNSRHESMELSEENRMEAQRLKESLSTNLQKLDLQMKAMKELNSTIEQAVLSDQSDGTYTVGDIAMRGYV